MLTEEAFDDAIYRGGVRLNEGEVVSNDGRCGRAGVGAEEMFVALPYILLKGPAVRERPRIVHSGEVRLEIHGAPVLCSVAPTERRVLVEKRLPRGDSVPQRIPGDLEGSIFREPHVVFDIPNREVFAHRRCE